MTRKRFKNEKYNELAKVPHNFNKVLEGETLTLNIMGDIGESWWDDSTSAADIVSALAGVEATNIVVNLSSPGGSAFDGIAIYNTLKEHPANVTINVPGWACSAASVIAMAADELNVGVGAMVMIHPAAVGIWGDKDELIKQSEMLSKLDESVLDIYMTKFKGTREELKVLVDNETWFTADESVEVGFANGVSENVTPENKLDSEAYKNSILERFRKESSTPAASSTPEAKPEPLKNILNQFKRD